MHHSSNPTTRLTDSNLQPPFMHMHKGYRQNTLQHHCHITYWNTGPNSGNCSGHTAVELIHNAASYIQPCTHCSSDNTGNYCFTLLFVLHIYVPINNMEVFVNSSSFKKGQFIVRLLKQQRQGLKAWTVNIIIFVIFNWSHLYISIAHSLLVGTITHPCITNSFASVICICRHCENTIKLILADQFPWVKNITETEWSKYIGKFYFCVSVHHSIG